MHGPAGNFRVYLAYGVTDMRKRFDTLFDEYERTKSPISKQAIRRIQGLYTIEAKITGMTAEERQRIRREHALPILTELKSWMTEKRRRLSSKTGLAKALQYALTR